MPRVRGAKHTENQTQNITKAVISIPKVIKSPVIPMKEVSEVTLTSFIRYQNVEFERRAGQITKCVLLREILEL